MSRNLAWRRHVLAFRRTGRPRALRRRGFLLSRQRRPALPRLTHIFLAEKGAFQNHFYLLSLLMIFLPAHRAFSIDALRSRVAHSATTPVWTLWLLRGQVALVYFYGGVTKLHADCLQGEPMRLRYLAPWQRRVIVNDPDMILQLCRYLKEEKRRLRGLRPHQCLAQRAPTATDARPERGLSQPVPRPAASAVDQAADRPATRTLKLSRY